MSQRNNGITPTMTGLLWKAKVTTFQLLRHATPGTLTHFLQDFVSTSLMASFRMKLPFKSGPAPTTTRITLTSTRSSRARTRYPRHRRPPTSKTTLERGMGRTKRQHRRTWIATLEASLIQKSFQLRASLHSPPDRSPPPRRPHPSARPSSGASLNRGWTRTTPDRCASSWVGSPRR